jgi:hypothetical protein
MATKHSKLPARQLPWMASIIVALTLGLVGCSREQLPVVEVTTKVEGQIFIVTKGAQNLKLGLVSVQVFDAAGCAVLERESADYIAGVALPKLARQAAREKFLLRDLPALEDDLELLEEKKARLEAKLADADAAADLSAQYDQIVRPLRESLTLMRGGSLDVLETGFLLEEGFQGAAQSALSAVDPISVMKTDADGRFSFEIPTQGPIALVASAQRMLIGDEVEHYHWCVKISPGTEQIFLSNDNMVSSTGPENLFTKLAFAITSPTSGPEFNRLVQQEWNQLRNRAEITAESDSLRELHKKAEALFQGVADQVAMRAAEIGKENAQAAAAKAEAEERNRQEGAALAVRKAREAAARTAKRAEDIGRSFAEIITASGRILRNLKISKFVDDGVIFGTQSGVIKVSYDDLPNELRDAYYDEEGVVKALARQEQRDRLLRQILARRDVLEGRVVKVNTHKDRGLIGTTMTSQHGAVFVFEYIGKNVGDSVSVPAFPTEKGLDGDGVQVWTLSAERAAGF